MRTVTRSLAFESPRLPRHFEPLLDTTGAVLVSQRHISCPSPCNLVKVMFSSYLVRICTVSLDSGCAGKPSFASSS
ncbi:hypothetical protein M405DRAFT_835388 [Rhizopogon salebrosus TDB-379]|nr:hypothetical protein M405DRAFT_835388 [Rhizopogon salebrosus TDB-379]